jgi:hypothetical protein
MSARHYVLGRAPGSIPPPPGVVVERAGGIDANEPQRSAPVGKHRCRPKATFSIAR